MVSKKIIFIVGPTAVGKSNVAVLLAKKIKGEIVSCDAMQVYKEINVASNKPSLKIRKTLKHHLINVVPIARDFNVVAFRQRALRAINAVLRKNKIPVVTGGSGLYMSVLLDGIFPGNKKSLKLRQKFEKEAERNGHHALYRKLEAVDPNAAGKIHPNDLKRIIRALEVYALTQKPISELQKNRRGLWGHYDISIFALNRERDKLYAMINDRVDGMFKAGLVKEIKSLRNKRWSKTAQSIIGVKEIMGFLKGSYDAERAKYLIKLNSRHLAKRQLTWFRRDKRLHWIMIDEKDKPAAVVQSILRKVNQHV